MSKMTKVHLDARRLAEEAGLNVVHLGTSRGGHVEMVVEKEGKTRKVFSPFSSVDQRAVLNQRAFLKRLSRSMAA